MFPCLQLSEYELCIASNLVDPKSMDVSWENIGGLDDVIQEIKEMVILPFKRADLFRHSTLLQPPKGAPSRVVATIIYFFFLVILTGHLVHSCQMNHFLLVIIQSALLVSLIFRSYFHGCQLMHTSNTSFVVCIICNQV